MKTMKFYIFGIALLSIVALTSCNRADEDIYIDDTATDGEGVLALSCDVSAGTRSVISGDEADDMLSDYILKIYSVDDNGVEELIRYYNPANELPEQLYLISGAYKATLSMQIDTEPTYATRNSAEFTYKGEESFTITAGEQTNAVISCGVLNSVVRMQLDASSFVTNGGSTTATYSFDSATGAIVIDPSGDATDDDNVVVKGIVGYVSVDECANAAEVMASASSRMLEYNFIAGDGSVGESVDFVCDDGYFMTCDGNTTFSYAISFQYSDKIDSDFETYTAFGKITNVKSETIYTLSMVCSEADRGDVGLNISLSEAVYDENTIDFSFSPQPTISGDGIDSSFIYTEGTRSYELAALLPMMDVTITRDGETLSLMSGGTVISGVSGVESFVLADDKLSATFTLNSDFYGEFEWGGENSYTIKVVDEKSAEGSEIAKAYTSGMINSITNADYWLNTGSLTAYISESAASTATIYCKRSSDSEWQELSMSEGIKSGVNTANIPAIWSDGFSNSEGNTVYTLDFGLCTMADYQCKLVVDGVQQGGVVTITSGGTKDTIPYGEMNNSGLSCFTSSNSTSTSWGSGNNTFSSSLCTYSTVSGSDGCAYLCATSVSLVDIAAGNLFLGQFDRPSLSSGEVSFGQSYTWNSRPTSFKFRYKATLGTVDANKHSGPLSTGSTDISTVYMAIVQWTGRHDVTSGTSSPDGVWSPASDMELDEGKIIGYALLDITSSNTSMTDTEIPVYYYDKVTNPSLSNISIVVSAATSKYGDYMNGSTSSKMWIDNFEFGY